MGAARHLHAREHASSGTYRAVTGSTAALTGNAPTLYDVNAMAPGVQASLMFKAALTSAGLSHAATGEILGVSAPRITAKCHPLRPDAPATIADVLGVGEHGGAAGAAALAYVIRGLQDVLASVTGQAAPISAAALPMIAVQLCARASEAADAATSAVIDGEITEADAARVLERLGKAARSLGVIERHVTLARRISR